MITRITLCLIFAIGGCAPYVEVQSRLVEQVRSGVAEVERSLEQKSHIVQAYHAQQRQRLDEAFDADVRLRDGSLDAQWVVEHRRAYAAAIDVLNTARSASERTGEADRANLAAVREALDRLEWLQSLPLRFTSTEAEDRP